MPLSNLPNKHQPEYRFFGRRMGRAVGDFQANLLQHFLPQVSYVVSDFDNIAHYHEKILDIGSGGGEQITHLAKNNPNNFYLAVEPFMNGVGKICQHIHDNHLKNVKIYADSFWNMFWDIPDNFFDKIFIYYPDPWRKTRHYSRRMITKHKILDLARILKKNGICEFASDDAVLIQSVMVDFYCSSQIFHWENSEPNQFLMRPQNLIATRYEMKAVAEKRTPIYLTYKKI